MLIPKGVGKFWTVTLRITKWNVPICSGTPRENAPLSSSKAKEEVPGGSWPFRKRFCWIVTIPVMGRVTIITCVYVMHRINQGTCRLPPILCRNGDSCQPDSQFHFYHEGAMVDFLYPVGFGYVRPRPCLRLQVPPAFVIWLCLFTKNGVGEVHYVQLIGILMHARAGSVSHRQATRAWNKSVREDAGT